MDDECPSCGGAMEPLRERHLSIVLSGDHAEGEMDVNDDDADIIAMVCVDCGYRDEAEYRGDPDDGEEDKDQDNSDPEA